MANYACLFASDNNGPPAVESEDSTVDCDELLLTSKYAIPALWMTLFDSSDIQQYEDPEDEIEIEYLVVSRNRGINRLTTAEAEFRKAFHNVARYCEEWLGLIHQSESHFFKADIFEITDMTEEGPSQLRHALQFFGNPTPRTTAAFLALSSIADVLDGQAVVHREESATEVSTLQRLMGVPA